MRFRIFFLLFLSASLSFAQSAVEHYSVLPQPQEIKYTGGDMALDQSPSISYSGHLKNEAELLRNYLKEDFGTDAVLTKSKRKANIALIIDKKADAARPEGYVINATADQVIVKAASPKGVFYGIQTLRQALRLQNGRLSVRKSMIEDHPAFSWRAFMLDEGRYFKGKQVVLDLLDRMAELKMNVFHWHLTDDQGWRIEIKKYPQLTQVGAFRDSSEINHFGSNVFDGRPHGGFYTQEEIKEIVAYATQRHITIVPEIEMPGHASAAIAAYPWLGTSGQAIKVPRNFGVHYNAFNVADSRVIGFLHDVLDEVMALFPSPVIHIGGDELRYDAWKASATVQNNMKEKGIASPAGLQVYFTNSISEYLASHNKRMMGWNEITGAQVNEYQQDGSGLADTKLSDKSIVHFWKGNPEMIKKTIEDGYDIVNSYHVYTYLDYNYGSIPLKQAYLFNPVPENITEEQKKKVLGLGCQMWGEFIPTVESMNKKIYPRIAAYAEVGWTEKANKDYDRFLKSLDRMTEKWQKRGIKLGDWK